MQPVIWIFFVRVRWAATSGRGYGTKWKRRGGNVELRFGIGCPRSSGSWEDVGALRPQFPRRGHFLHALRLRWGEVIHLGAIKIHVVKLPWGGAERDEFPFSIAERAIALVLPSEHPGRQ